MRDAVSVSQARQRRNWPLIAWQIIWLVSAPLGFLGYWMLGQYGFIHSGWWIRLLIPIMDNLSGLYKPGFAAMWLMSPVWVVSVVFVVAIFWRKRWAVYGFSAINAALLLMYAYGAIRSLTKFGLELWWFESGPLAAYSMIHLVAGLLLLAAIRLGNSRGVGWSTFGKQRGDV